MQINTLIETAANGLFKKTSCKQKTRAKMKQTAGLIANVSYLKTKLIDLDTSTI